MSSRRCKNCLSTDLRDSRPMWWDSRGLQFFIRPVRCHHCDTRQYVPANEVLRSITATFHRIDDGINQLHPEALRELLDPGERPATIRTDHAELPRNGV